MKNVIFRKLFLEKSESVVESKDSTNLRRYTKLSYNEQIVYSAYIWYAVNNNACYFMKLWLEKNFEMLEMEGLYNEETNLYSVPFIPPSNQWMQNYCKLPRTSILAAINSLWNNDLLDYGEENGDLIIYIDRKIFDGGYIELIYPNNDNTGYIDEKTKKIVNINSHDIILYSYLKHKSKKFYNTIDTYIAKLASELSVCERDMKRYIARLKNFGLIERLPNGRLKIN